MKRARIALSIAASVTVLLSAAWGLGRFRLEPVAAQSAGDSVIYLDQAWSQADREAYYQISQGSRVISYDIFLNLEVAGSEDLFRSDANSDHYGLIPQAPNPQTNPDALPVGLTKTVVPEGRWKGDAIGLNCAACHNSELTYKGKRVRIEGGSNHTFDFMSYVDALDDALQATLIDAAKFDRLAMRIGASSADAKSELRKRYEIDAARVHEYRTRTMPTPVAWGPGRIDAFNLITDRVLATETGIGQNWSAPMAPVKPPFVWNAPQGSWTQWAGSQQDPLIRNYGETTGVFLSMDLRSKTPEAGLFDSSAAILNLQKIENLISRLAPPKWPEDVFGKIDRAKAAEGKKLFAANCAECHNSYPYTWTEPNKFGKRFIAVGLVPQKFVGTDPAQFETTQAYAITGDLSGYLPPPNKGAEIVPVQEMRRALIVGPLSRAMKALNLDPAELINLNGYREMPGPPPPVESWKAAPRDGVWATAPFLHNGSVPNLYEMLIPARERTKKFYVGREFDPVKVGVDTTGNSGTFLFDTTLFGNSNAGHSFEDAPLGNGVVGRLLTDDERWALIEYLKSIPEEPGRVTPFGGPPDAHSGHVKWEGPTEK
ncbi:MAG: di-heme-cytochrome C peroxidase [Candidatus Acidiferrales bacterium]